MFVKKFRGYLSCAVILFVIKVCDSEIVSKHVESEHEDTTTFRYPTATWSANNHHHSKKKISPADMWKLYLFKPSPFLKPPFTDGEAGTSISSIDDGLNVNGRRRGKIKWKDGDYTEYSPSKESKDKYLNKFLEDALHRYIKSANLTDEYGTITLEMFSEALNRITSLRKLAYDENKEMHRKFKEDNLSMKKVEIPTTASLVERLYEKRRDMFWDVSTNENISVPSRGALLERKDNKLMYTEPTPLSTVTTLFTKTNYGIEGKDVSKHYENSAVTTGYKLPTTGEMSSFSTTFTPTQLTIPTKFVKYVTTVTSTPLSIPTKASKYTAKKNKRGHKKYRDTLPKQSSDHNENEDQFQLSVAESAHYRPRPQVTEEKEVKYGAIPGIPNVDYPTLSHAPSTGFRCPKLLAGASKMIADSKAQCQVFYMCSGDAPPTPMLCPNGTLFNENVLVCDWWFNVHCQTP